MSPNQPIGACLDEAELAEFVAGALDVSGLERAERHLDGCDECRALVRTVVETQRPEPTLAAPTRGTAIGRFIIVDEVGRGGSGQVFSAYDATLDRRVALKLLRPAASTEAKQKRLEAEARALARLTHPNVITIYEAGRWSERAYLCMEFIAGGTIRDWVAARPRSWRDVVQLFLDAGAGLAAAHAVGLVHRDIKPENILVRPDGRAVVTDFGLATEASVELELDARLSAMPRHTLEAGFVGTPAYMAPDQLRGARSDARSDQFSFCVSLAEMLWGARPFEASTVGGLLDAIEARQLRFPSAGPRRLKRVLERGLSANPSARYPSMQTLLEELERATRRVAVLPIATALAVAVVAVIGATRWQGTREGPCAVSDERLAALWSPERAAAVTSALVATGVPYAEKAAQRVTASMNERVAVLRSTRGDACRLLESGRDVSGYWSRRVSCLDERAAELEALVVQLRSPERALVSVAPELIDRLPGVRACRFESTAPEPTAAMRERRETLLAAATVASTLLALGRPSEAAARLEAERAAASSGRLVPGYELQRSLVVRALEGPTAATPLLVATALEAQRQEEHFVAAVAYLELCAQELQRLQPVPAGSWLEHARAVAEKVNEPGLSLRVEAASAELKVRVGDPAGAATSLTQVLSQLERESGVREDVQRMRVTVGLALKESGNPRAALASIEATIRDAETALGERHPHTLEAMGLRALIIEQLGRPEEATRALEAVLAAYGPPTPAIAPQVLRWSNNLAYLFVVQRRFADAERVMDAVAPAWDAAFGPESMGAPAVIETVGAAKLGVGKVDEALRAAERGLELCRRSRCLAHQEGSLQFLRARALEVSGQPEEATRAATTAEFLFKLSPSETGRWRIERLEQWRRDRAR